MMAGTLQRLPPCYVTNGTILELSEAAEKKINKIYLKLNCHFCVHYPENHHNPPGKHLSFYQGDIRLTKKQAENLKKYDDPTKG